MFSKRSVDAAPDTAELVRRYAEGFHAGALTEHAVTSALGLWLLLALLAPASRGDARTELEAHLGCGADDASRRARLLLAAPHPAVRAAVAVWANPGFVNDDQRRWQQPLTGDVETGPIPTQAAADGWAAERTDGMIDTFPIAIRPDTAVVLASALAAEVAWAVPFADAAPHLLGGPFGDRVATALEAPRLHTQALVDTEAAGIVAVHVADAASGLDVVSVLAGEHVERDAVLAATLEVGLHLDAVRRGLHGRVDVFALPLGEGAAWSIEERQVERSDGSGDRHTAFHTYLAAWSAQSEHDLSTAPGIAAAFAALDGFLVEDLRPGLFEARQTAVAEYRRDGFRAAAVTAIGVRAGSAAPAPRRVNQRDVTVRFNRPYAVLAVAADHCTDPDRPWEQIGVDEPSWAGMPVFAAWVTTPDATTSPAPTERGAVPATHRGAHVGDLPSRRSPT